jgi:hypothetical protein
VKFEEFEPALQLAITEIINPAYEELVLGARTALERCSGLTYVHLCWIEVIEQIDMAKEQGKALPRGETRGANGWRLHDHLRLVAQKDKVAKFLLELERFREKAGDKDPLRRVPR